MRSPKILSAIFALFVVLSISYWLKNEKPNPPMPLPTEVVKSNLTEGQKHKQKKAWEEAMHKTAPGVDWRKQDHATRIALASKRKSLNRFSAVDTFANGKLIGSWEERGSNNQSGRILMNYYDAQNQIIYSLSQGGNLWKGYNDGTNWQVVNDAQNFGSSNFLKLFPSSNGQRIFVSTSSKDCFYSDDDGLTWLTSKGFDNVKSWGNIRKSVSIEDAEETIFSMVLEWDYVDWGSIMSIYVSKDKGENFQKLRSIKRSVGGSNSNHYDIWASANQLYYLQKDSLFTVDATNNLQFKNKMPVNPSSRVYLTGSKYYSNDILYAFLDQDIYKSPNGGISWTLKGNTGNNPFRNTSFFARQQDTNTIYLGGVNCYVSTNAGQDWNFINEWWEYYGDVENKLHADIPSISEFEDQNGNSFVLISTDGGLYKSSNPMVVKNLSMVGHNVSQYYSVYTNQNDDNFIYAGTQDQGFQRTNFDNGGILNFEQVISGDYGYIVSSNGGNSFWTVYPGFAHYYPDGKNSTADGRWNFDSLRGEFWIPPLEEHPLNPEKVYLAGGHLKANVPGSFIIELNKVGNNIVAQELPYNFSQVSGEKISAFEISDIDSDYWYVLTNEGYFYNSKDGGQTFTKKVIIDGPGAHYFYGASIHCSSINKDVVFIAGSGYNTPPVFWTNDGGQTIEALSDSIPNTLVFDIIATPNDSLVFASTEVGPFVLYLETKIWEPMFGSKAPLQRYWSSEYVPSTKTIRFGTHGRGIWDFVPYNPPVAGLADEKGDLKLTVYPNPTTTALFVKGLTPNATVICFALNGKQLPINRTQNQIDVSQLPHGTYLLAIQQNEKKELFKFIKQ